jgi:nucleoside-diphosphate-sugar epimerase
LLGYRPAMRLEEGLEKFVAWYRMVRPSRCA